MGGTMKALNRAAALPLLCLWAGTAVADGLDSGDTAWMLTSTALVLFMTLPGLALFYGGLVRSRNVLFSDATGDVDAVIDVSRASNSPDPPNVLQISAFVGHSADGIVAFVDLGTLALGQTVTLRMAWLPDENRVEFQRDQLAEQGKVYEPEFKELVVEHVRQWKHSNAFVTTVEVWDVRSYALGSRVLLSDVTNQRNRVKYQLKLKDHGWVILYRELDQTLSSD